ncbi:hypothetical protein Tco_0541367 [Tanacetum coccineum]
MSCSKCRLRKTYTTEEQKGFHDNCSTHANLKKYLADPTLQIPLDEIKFDCGKPVENLKREVQELKRRNHCHRQGSVEVKSDLNSLGSVERSNELKGPDCSYE